MLDFYKKNKRKNAFTIVEIMITILIIGVVAGLTLPNLLNAINEQQTVRKLEKTYSRIQQSYQLAKEEFGTVDGWGIGANKESSIIILSRLLYNVKKGQICAGSSEENRRCGWNYPTKLFNGAAYDYLNSRINYVGSTQLSDGVVISVLPHVYGALNVSNSVDVSVGWIYVDVNGLNKPNTNGKDIFLFHVTNNGIVPFGSKNDKSNWNFNNCRNTGYGCAFWVLKQKNMKYLKNHKCSLTNLTCK